MSDASDEVKKDAASDNNESEQESGKMSFLDHLDELRRRLVRIAICLVIGFCACWFFAPRIYDFLALPFIQLLPEGKKLSYNNPTDPFIIYMKVALLAGIFLTLPFTLFEVWKFISPGLYRKEKKYIIPFLFCSVVLFISGAAFCYYYVLPPAFRFLIELGESFDPVVMVREYLDLTNTMLLGFGLIFEMPVIVAFLSMFGLISAEFLVKQFRYAFVGMVILAAVLSPTSDIFNLMLWTAPMLLLYGISICVAFLMGRRRKKKGLA